MKTVKCYVNYIQKSLTDDLLSPKWKKLKTTHPQSGHCYIAAEALYHLIGKELGYMPHVLTHYLWPEGLNKGETHWFLKKKNDILDPTAGQFDIEIAYHLGKCCGFLTKQPSKRATILIERCLCYI